MAFPRKPKFAASAQTLSIASILAAAATAWGVGCSARGEEAFEASARIETNAECPFLRPTKTGTRVTYSVKTSARTSSHSRIETNRGLTDPEMGQFASSSYDWEVSEATAADGGSEVSIETTHVDSNRCSTARILESGATTEVLLDGPPEAKHKFEVVHGGVKYIREWSADESTVTVPAGTFKHCWTLTTHRSSAEKATSVEVHCKGLGLVRADFARQSTTAEKRDAGRVADASNDASDSADLDSGARDESDAGAAADSGTEALLQEHWELSRHSWSLDEDDAGSSARDAADSDSANVEGGPASAEAGTVDAGSADAARDEAGRNANASDASSDSAAEAGDGGRSTGSSGRVPDDFDDLDDFDDTTRSGSTGSSQPQTPRVIGEEENTSVSSKFKGGESRRACSTAPVGSGGSTPGAFFGMGVFAFAALSRSSRRRSKRS
jgi:hypothetical protein